MIWEQRSRAAPPDREAGMRAALESEPRYLKLMRALCRNAGREVSHATGADPSHQHNGQRVLAWHFITDKGHHYMVEENGGAMMYHGATNKPVVEIEAL
jgi:hypothetical protein